MQPVAKGKYTSNTKPDKDQTGAKSNRRQGRESTQLMQSAENSMQPMLGCLARESVKGTGWPGEKIMQPCACAGNVRWQEHEFWPKRPSDVF